LNIVDEILIKVGPITSGYGCNQIGPKNNQRNSRTFTKYPLKKHAHSRENYFGLGLLKIDRKHSVFTDGRIWYSPQECRFLILITTLIALWRKT
jgi:hypothetical protein